MRGGLPAIYDKATPGRIGPETKPGGRIYRNKTPYFSFVANIWGTRKDCKSVSSGASAAYLDARSVLAEIPADHSTGFGRAGMTVVKGGEWGGRRRISPKEIFEKRLQ